jgi:uncharacterized membrane protein
VGSSPTHRNQIHLATLDKGLNRSMNKTFSILTLLFIAGCAQVGPVEITDTDTIWTVGIAFIIAVLVFVIKGYIEYLFAKRLERYKKQLEKDIRSGKRMM